MEKDGFEWNNNLAEWPQVLLNSSFFHKRKEVIEGIDREGRQVGKLYFPEKRLKLASLVTKAKLKELYRGQRRSLQGIANEYGCTKQWIFPLMKKYGLKRRTLSDAQKAAIKQGRG